MRRVTIFDYGAGNLHSLAKALAEPGIEVRVEPDPIRATETDVLVLPGVGSFAQAAGRLAPGREAMRAAMLHDGLPTLGVCLGMQLFFGESEEGPGRGLGIIPGRVTRLAARRVPQIGWNTLEDARDPLFDAAPMAVAYYANSFACRPATDDAVIAWSRHEDDRFAAAARAGAAGNVVGVQFHPEKSSGAGVRLIKAFLAEAVRGAPRPSARSAGSQADTRADRAPYPTHQRSRDSDSRS
jgi:glutamine amidotransferase